jgi:hypothetical protein
VPRPQWGDFGALWKTIREVDINAIRHEAERSVAILCLGQPAALLSVDRILHDGSNRYPLGSGPLALVPLAEAGDYRDALRAADLLIVALDAWSPLDDAEMVALARLTKAPRARQVVLLFGEGAEAAAAGSAEDAAAASEALADEAATRPWGAAAGTSRPWPASLDRGAAKLVDPQSSDAAVIVAGAVLDALPAEARLAAARHLPGLRPLFASRLTLEVSMSNAAFAVASGVPSLVPILGIPISAADTVILTKNQALMVYRLALACGAPPDFQKRMIEITPVIGGAVVWRQIAGALVGLVPGYGIVPKTAVAFGGTYMVGLAATRWYETGLLTEAERKRITAEATTKAREVATTLVEQTRAAGGKAGAQAQGGLRKAADGLAAAGSRAGKAVGGARKATGAAAGKAGAAASDAAGKAGAAAGAATQSAARRLRAGGSRIARRGRPAAPGGAEGIGNPPEPPGGSATGG